MGFFESLRQEKDTRERREAAERERREAPRRQRELEARREMEERIRQEDMKRQRQKESLAFFKESGLKDILDQFRSLVSGEASSNYGTKGDFDDSFRFEFEELKQRRNPDSFIYGLTWDEHHISADMKLGHRYRGKTLYVEVCPDGTIVFHGRFSTTVGLDSWRNSHHLFENELEVAYESPIERKWYVPWEPTPWVQGPG